MMHFGFCVNDAYIPYIAVTIKSIQVHHPDEDLVFWILTDGVSEKNRARLQDEFNASPRISFHIIPVDRTKVSGLRRGKQHESVWYRVLFPEYLPSDVGRILFLDADILVLDNLKELFARDMDGVSVAGCPDPLGFESDTFERLEYDPALGYVCAGVLLINLDYWREHNLEERLIGYATEQAGRLRFWDQDTINFVCKDTKVILPLRFGIMERYFSWELRDRIGTREELRGCLTDPAIVHFAGNAPWKKELSRMVFHDDWQRYNRMLKRPVVRKYSIKGIALLKHLAWNIVFHKKRKSRLITKETALRLTAPEMTAR